MSKNPQRDLRKLLDSFETVFPPERFAELQSYVDHGEPGLAIEMLSDWIYDDHVFVSAEQEEAIMRSSTDFGINHSYHAFAGRKPPYPDLRTPEQIADNLRSQTATMENVEYFARANQKIIAIKLYREISRAGLEEAAASVEHLVANENPPTPKT